MLPSKSFPASGPSVTLSIVAGEVVVVIATSVVAVDEVVVIVVAVVVVVVVVVDFVVVNRVSGTRGFALDP